MLPPRTIVTLYPFFIIIVLLIEFKFSIYHITIIAIIPLFECIEAFPTEEKHIRFITQILHEFSLVYVRGVGNDYSAYSVLAFVVEELFVRERRIELGKSGGLKVFERERTVGELSCEGVDEEVEVIGSGFRKRRKGRVG